MLKTSLSKAIQTDLIQLEMPEFVEVINQRIESQLSSNNHGDFTRWMKAFDCLPSVSNVILDVSRNEVTINGEFQGQSDLKANLQQLIPWRKGPYKLSDIEIDCEWRSDFKWERIKSHLNLKDKRVLDIGCGNGYHCWRMLDQSPKWVLGIDPNILFNLQFRFFNQFARREDIDVVPLGIEHLPNEISIFDTVFSMGVLYHRKSPIDHLYELKSLLAKGGELILETLIIEGDENSVLVPQGRYAKMRNVWFIPSVMALTNWLKKVGFVDVNVLDISITTTREQRSTEWMLFESLSDYLDKNDQSLTIEGHPAPKRVVILAK